CPIFLAHVTTKAEDKSKEKRLEDVPIVQDFPEVFLEDLSERDADRSRNGDNNNDSGTGRRRQITTLRECTYTDFLKCQPMSFQGTEGVVVKGLDLLNYNHRFQELALMCKRVFPEELDKVERYIGGLPDMIHGGVKASKPQSMQEAIEFATEMMDKKMLIHAEHQAEQKRKFHDTSRNSQHQQQPFKKNNVARDYIGPVHRSAPTIRRLAIGPVIVKSDLLLPTTTTNNNNNPNNNNQRAQGANTRGITCFECGVQGYYKSDCPKLKNGNQGNRAGNGNVVARAYDVGTVGTNPNSNVVTDKSKEKRLEDIPIVQDFPEVFPEDFP
nr:hypothetical protein [Tanacetum cinerariifolium]